MTIEAMIDAAISGGVIGFSIFISMMALLTIAFLIRHYVQRPK